MFASLVLPQGGECQALLLTRGQQRTGDQLARHHVGYVADEDVRQEMHRRDVVGAAVVTLAGSAAPRHVAQSAAGLLHRYCNTAGDVTTIVVEHAPLLAREGLAEPVAVANVAAPRERRCGPSAP